MKVATSSATAPNAARGEALLTIGGEQYPVRFGMNVMRDFSKLTGKAPSEFGALLGQDYIEALTGIVCCAVRRHVPRAVFEAQFTQDDAADLIDGLSAEEVDALAEGITEAVSVGPLMAALMAKVTAKNEASQPEATPPANGTSTSTLPSES